jgi:hypothetical protein
MGDSIVAKQRQKRRGRLGRLRRALGPEDQAYRRALPRRQALRSRVFALPVMPSCHQPGLAHPMSGSFGKAHQCCLILITASRRKISA